MNNLIFPENVPTLPRSKRPLQFKHLLAVVYAFGGLTGLAYILSKFIVMPLFEQLTFDRRLLVEDARERLSQLNARLTHAVSKVPSFTVSRSDYVEQAVQADRTNKPATADDNASASTPALKSSDPTITAKADEYIASLRELLQSFKMSDPNDEGLKAHTQISSQADALAKYVRSVKYESVPSSLIGMGFSKSKKEGEALTLSEAIIDCKLEIRALKSSILSGK